MADPLTRTIFHNPRKWGKASGQMRGISFQGIPIMVDTSVPRGEIIASEGIGFLQRSSTVKFDPTRDHTDQIMRDLRASFVQQGAVEPQSFFMHPNTFQNYKTSINWFVQAQAAEEQAFLYGTAPSSPSVPDLSGGKLILRLNGA